jgi:hypothetical protein
MLLDAQILAANAFLAGEISLLPYPSPKLAYLRRGTESWRVRFRANIGSERRAQSGAIDPNRNSEKLMRTYEAALPRLSVSQTGSDRYSA